MPIPPALSRNLALPAIASPMFLVSGPELVLASCNAGVIGTFPALNQRTTEGFAEWCDIIEGGRTPDAAAWGVNLVVHRSNTRIDADLKVVADKKVPLIITSLGAVKELVDEVHAYGGAVFHDVINLRHARKAAEAGVDGLILVCNGAGGHAGTLNPFAFVSEVRQMFSGTIVLAGCLNTGRDVAAARVMGADFAYLGTRFIATQESRGPDDYKQMIIEAEAKDIVYTPAISGVHGSFMRQSIVEAGLDPDNLPEGHQIDFSKEGREARAWKTVWSAGQGVGGIHDNPTTAELVARLKAEYDAAIAEAGRPF
ncbi:NAD(P)H-dependent flavin oxidoreductase [Futiania mangrovi]|uniref:Nitronate monooxygenase family protein n=1 Tax=Futiania mangrovi TaxID=2959716 RepID=A0A9J6PDW6_9PROT|nr:nitronate monooxygenase family protein [Futiania mangrovii]MCP1335931.1 nitronate monooxygenase family protein [Futiania mangrovii]